MAQRKKSGEPRQITRYQLNFKKDKQKGVYYINYPKKTQAIKKQRILKKDFPKVSWTIRKTKRNAWVKKSTR